jgi:hypothetical protein
LKLAPVLAHPTRAIAAMIVIVFFMVSPVDGAVAPFS